MQDALRKNTKIFKKKYYSKLSTNDILQLIKPIPNVTDPYYKVFLMTKKIPFIPPLIHNNQFALDFKEKK